MKLLFTSFNSTKVFSIQQCQTLLETMAATYK